MHVKTPCLLLVLAVAAGCFDPCPSGAGGDLIVRDGRITVTQYTGLGSQTSQLGTMDQPDGQLARCTEFWSMKFFGPIKGPLSIFDHVEGVGSLEFNWMALDELDAFPALRNLGNLEFRGFEGSGPDPNRGENDRIPLDAELLRIDRISGFPELEYLGTVKKFGSGRTGSWVGFGSLERIDSFDFSDGTSAESFEGLSTVASMGELLISGSATPTFTDFRSLTEIDGDLALGSMARLRTLGFDALEVVGGDLSLQQLGLREWNGLQSLTSVGRNLNLANISCVPQADVESWVEQVNIGGTYDSRNIGNFQGVGTCAEE